MSVPPVTVKTVMEGYDWTSYQLREALLAAIGERGILETLQTPPLKDKGKHLRRIALVITHLEDAILRHASMEEGSRIP